MNAQEITWTSDNQAIIYWKYYYRLFHTGIFTHDNRITMRRFRREAALERRCAALERENAHLQELLNMAHFAVWQERL